ncbi:MAG: alpha/beta hydrolase [Pseudomonadota bacterium]
MQLMSEQQWAERCAEDGEFRLASRHWNGGITLSIGEQKLSLALDEGGVSPGVTQHTDGLIEYAGPEDTWEKLLAQVPERFHNDLMANISQAQGLSLSADSVVHGQYYAAVIRAVELLRPARDMGQPTVKDVGAAGRFDMPVGRYVHLNLDGADHRIYFEEAGQGIPILMQHTAGCHGSQWRHLFEVPEITERFRLIAYDLPYHGKSMPPVEKQWWSQEYNLEGDFLRSVPVKLAQALDLKDPVFMGCSVGGLLALDLAHKHADLFKAVISVEGALHIEGSTANFGEFWHPQVNNEYKARLMDGLMSPNSPEAYRKETSFVYASGWPPVFIGDLHYYVEDYDLRGVAGEIDTNKVGVHILSGEYDYSGTSELGQEVHQSIAGSTWVEMKGVGHFPMSENPAAFIEYLLPVLDRIA